MPQNICSLCKRFLSHRQDVPDDDNLVYVVLGAAEPLGVVFEKLDRLRILLNLCSRCR